MECVDELGNSHYQGGGGIAVEADGSERPLTEEELMENRLVPQLEHCEDGSVWICWFDKVAEVTDKF